MPQTSSGAEFYRLPHTRADLAFSQLPLALPFPFSTRVSLSPWLSSQTLTCRSHDACSRYRARPTRHGPPSPPARPTRKELATPQPGGHGRLLCRLCHCHWSFGPVHLPQNVGSSSKKANYIDSRERERE